MKKLKVPKIGAKDTCGCGPTSMAMVLHYYKQPLTEKEIIKQIGGLRRMGKYKGSMLVENALIAAEKGFKVECYAYNCYVLNPRWMGISKEKLISKIKKISKVKREDNALIKSLLSLLNHKNTIYKIKQPSKEDLINCIKNEIPPIIGVSTSILWQSKRLDEGHMIVMTGYDGKNFYYNDPYDGHEHKINENKLMFAWHNNVINSSAYLIKVLRQ